MKTRKGTDNNNFRHGYALAGRPSKEYSRWAGMIKRCENARCQDYANYGARGITVCNSWRKNFVSFLNDMGPCPDRFTLDRIDSDGNYEPGNCRWASRTEQNRNTRRNVFMTLDGKTKSLREWAIDTRIDYDCLRWRHKQGWSDLKTLTTPSMRKHA